ncbi:MAG: nucleotide exchange factor GrpE [Bacillota bacterium]
MSADESLEQDPQGKEVQEVTNEEPLEQDGAKSDAVEQESEETTETKLVDYLAENNKKLEQANEQLKKEVEESYHQFLHAKADFENFRKRNRRETEDRLKYAALPLLEKMLAVLDNFERALAVYDEEKVAPFFYEGVNMVYRQFDDLLKQSGLERIESLSTMFDPAYHHVIGEIEDAEVEPGLVLEEVQVGYKYLERVVRPTQVRISKLPEHKEE